MSAVQFESESSPTQIKEAPSIMGLSVRDSVSADNYSMLTLSSTESSVDLDLSVDKDITQVFQSALVLDSRTFIVLSSES